MSTMSNSGGDGEMVSHPTSAIQQLMTYQHGAWGYISTQSHSKQYSDTVTCASKSVLSVGGLHHHQKFADNLVCSGIKRGGEMRREEWVQLRRMNLAHFSMNHGWAWYYE